MSDQPTRKPADKSSKTSQQAVMTDAHGATDERIVERPLGTATRSGIPRILLILIGLAAGWLVTTGMRELTSVVAPIFFALTLMIAAYPIKTFLTRRGLPEWLGSLACGLTVLGTLVVFFLAVGWAVAAFVAEMPKYQGKFWDLFHQSLNLATRFGVNETQLREMVRGLDPGSIFAVAQSALGGLSSGLTVLTVVATVIIFMIMDANHFAARLESVEKFHPNLAIGLTMFAGGVRRYWVITTIFGLIVAILDLGVMLILGVPLALVWAVLAFLTNYIPSIGFIIGVIPPTLMALLVHPTPLQAILVVVLFSLLNFIVQSLIQPRFAGDAIGVTPTIAFVSLLFWGWVWGLLGALLALPLTLLFRALLVDTDPESRWVNALISNDVKNAEPH